LKDGKIMSLPNQELSKELLDRKSIARAIVYFTKKYLFLEKISRISHCAMSYFPGKSSFYSL